jgi:hypothetical protein
VTPQAVRDFLEAVGTTDWHLDYAIFCRRLGQGPDSPAADQWRKWQALAAAAHRFDAETLCKILCPQEARLDAYATQAREPLIDALKRTNADPEEWAQESRQGLPSVDAGELVESVLPRDCSGVDPARPGGDWSETIDLREEAARPVCGWCGESDTHPGQFVGESWVCSDACRVKLEKACANPPKRFKVGDKVTPIRSNGLLLAGKIYTVADANNWPHGQRIDVGGWWDASDFRLADPDPLAATGTSR